MHLKGWGCGGGGGTGGFIDIEGDDEDGIDPDVAAEFDMGLDIHSVGTFQLDGCATNAESMSLPAG